MTVIKLRQPLRKRARAALRALIPARKDRLGYAATAMIIVAMIVDMRGDTSKATFIVSLTIVLLLLIRDER